MYFLKTCILSQSSENAKYMDRLIVMTKFYYLFQFLNLSNARIRINKLYLYDVYIIYITIVKRIVFNRYALNLLFA